jgi:hypothetical protein
MENQAELRVDRKKEKDNRQKKTEKRSKIKKKVNYKRDRLQNET